MKLKPNYLKLLKKSNYFSYLRGNYYVKDLIDVLIEPNVKASDFIYTKFVNTIVLIVSVPVIDDFLSQYQFWTENVIPGSARRLAVP